METFRREDESMSIRSQSIYGRAQRYIHIPRTSKNLAELSGRGQTFRAWVASKEYYTAVRSINWRSSTAHLDLAIRDWTYVQVICHRLVLILTK